MLDYWIDEETRVATEVIFNLQPYLEIGIFSLDLANQYVYK